MRKLKVFLVIGLMAAFAANASAFVYTVDEGERAIEVRGGEMKNEIGEPYEPGFGFYIPIIDKPHSFETRVRAYDMRGNQEFNWRTMEDSSISAKTDGELNIDLELTVKYRIDADEVPKIYQNIGTEERVRTQIIRPTVRGSFRDEASQYSRQEIVTDDREEFISGAEYRMSKEFEEYGIEITEINIRDINYPEHVEEAIAEKEAESERILKAEREIETAKRQAQARIETARGQARSQQIISQALTPQYVQWFYIEQGLQEADTIFVPTGQDGLQMMNDVGSWQQQSGELDLDFEDFNAEEVEEELDQLEQPE